MLSSFQDIEDISSDQPRQRWFIDLEWYQHNNRSFFFLAKSCLCPKCRELVKGDEGAVPVANVLKAIKNCCSKCPDFITSRQPVLDSIFRLFLANGNQPLDIEEMSNQLSERRGANAYPTSYEVLSRLLKNDHYYGLRQVQETGG